jgi:hypothetical protein
MAEYDAFGRSRTAAGEEEEGFIPPTFARYAKDESKKESGEDFAQNEPHDDLHLQLWQESLDEDEVLAGGPGELLGFADKDVGSDEAVDIGGLDGVLDSRASGGEIEVYGDLAREEDGDVGDESADTRRQDDADALLFCLGSDVPGECRSDGEDSVIAQRFIIFAVDDFVSAAVAFEAEEHGIGEVHAEGRM